MSHGRWTEQDVMNIVTNPVYVGLGPFPRLVEDDVFIAAVKNVMKEKGARATLENLREQLQLSLNRQVECVAHPRWIDDSVATIKREGATIFFRQLLRQIREEID